MAPCGMRAAVNLQHRRILRALFEVDGLHDPAVDGQPVEAFKLDLHDFRLFNVHAAAHRSHT